MAGDGLDPRRLSHSRLDSLLRCGKAFESHYVHGLPREMSGGAALFGTVFHTALEKWSLDRSQDLVAGVELAWLLETRGTSVADFITAYAPMSVRTRALIDEILKRRPDVKAPRMTKEFKDSKESRESYLLFRDWLPKLNASSDLRFTIRDPLPTLYDDSLVLADRYAKRMRHLPTSLVTEFEFSVEWQGFTLVGHIDSIEPLIDRPSGELIGLAIVDYKTSKQPGAPLKYFRQLGFYDIAVEQLIERGAISVPDVYLELPRYPGIDWVRWTDAWLPIRKREFLVLGDRDRKRLREDCEAYSRMIENKIYLPAHTFTDAQYCDYGAACCLLSCSMAGGEAKTLEGVVV